MLLSVRVHLPVLTVLVCLHLDVEIRDASHQRRNILIRLPQLLLILGILSLKMVKLAHAVNLYSLILLGEILNSVGEVDPISLDLGSFIFVMSLDLSYLLVGSLYGLLSMISGSLRVVVTVCSIFEVGLGLLKLALSCLGVFSKCFDKIFILGQGNFVVSNE